MAIWHVWGDYVHTLPEHIGDASVVRGQEKAAKKTAEGRGFDFTHRLRNGFEPWAAAFAADGDEGDVEFEFASYPIVRGWQKI
ncbi:MAG TPA: hypothetical protein VGG89_00285 [Candidatus Baltobacteraceae bacterium]|jgi:hypothetical protein